MYCPEYVRIVDVGPRDGLQNHPDPVPLDIKITLIDRLADAGLPSIEAGAFVSPKWVPQMADTADVMRGIRQHENVDYPVLVPNMRGFEAALAAGCQEVAVFAAATEAFSQKNINCSIDASLDRFVPVLAAAADNDVRVRGYISCVLGCPYEGGVAPDAVAWVAKRLYDMGCYEVSLGDTIGVGTPIKAREMITAVATAVPMDRLAVHFHDTYGQALANILAVMDMGVHVVDTAISGLGGCPYAKGATGNVATEDVVYMLQGMGVKTGIDLQELLSVSQFISDAIGRLPASRVALATGTGAT